MNKAYNAPDKIDIIKCLNQIKTIAVLGLSPKPKRPSYRVSKAMQEYGYRIIPVRPAVDEVLGEKAYAQLKDIDTEFDLLNVFRAPEYVDAIVDECITLGIKAIWLQEGVINEAAAARAQAAGMFVVMDRCIYKDYINYLL